MHVSFGVWLASVVAVLVLFVADMAVLRHSTVSTFKRSVVATGIYSLLGIGFAAVLLVCYGGDYAGQYLSGYVLERTLSIDNVLVFVTILSLFSVPKPLHDVALFWGIAVSLVLRAIFVAIGAGVLDSVSWITYVFGAFLVFTAWKMWHQRSEHVDLDRNRALRLLKRFVPLADRYDESRLTTRIDTGKRVATPLVAVLVVLGTTDVAFAVDSIPAVFAVTDSAYLVFAANAYAMLGLRSMTEVVAAVVRRFVYLKPALALVLGLVGVKMILEHHIEISAKVTIGSIVLIIGTSILISVMKARRVTRMTANARAKVSSDHLDLSA